MSKSPKLVYQHILDQFLYLPLKLFPFCIKGSVSEVFSEIYKLVLLQKVRVNIDAITSP